MIAERIKLMMIARASNRLRMNLMRTAALALVLLASGALAAAAQQVDPSKPPPPPPSAEPAPAPAADSAGAPAAPAAPAFDPLHAQKSLEVGQYYLKTGDYPAAIDRFKEALGYQSNLAPAWDFLGQACEKEHERDDAIAAYQKYLAMVPDGKESEKARKRLAKLQAAKASGK